VALSFPDDFPFNRRSREPEAPMKPQSQVQQPAAHSEARAQVEPAPQQRTRPAVPEGARAPAAAITEAQAPIPMPRPSTGEVPVAAQPVAPRAQAQAATNAMAQAPAHPPVTSAYPRANERRRSPRQTLVAKAVVRSEFNQNTVATGFLSNISMLGVGFHTRRPLAVGEKFQMRLELGPMRWATRLRVVSCQPHDSGTYDIGAEFIGSDLVDRVQRELAA
jgi:hypothetical protein